MKQIKIYGEFSYLPCYIDDEDFDEVDSWKWYGDKDRNTVYISTNCYYNGKRTRMSMH